jgi:hypothetical protein
VGLGSGLEIGFAGKQVMLDVKLLNWDRLHFGDLELLLGIVFRTQLE